MKDKKLLTFPTKNEADVKKNPRKEKITIKITNEKLLENKQEYPAMFLDIEALHDKIMKDAPNFSIFNLLIQVEDKPMTYIDVPQEKEELKKYNELCDLQAQALIHTLSYIPGETLTKFLEYIEQFKAYYDEFDANENYPLDKEHEYFQFFNKMKDAANKLKENHNEKADRD